ncbi:MAG: PAS domain S-box protein, partial [Planctomycetes bacterium]|nr:PAS domain S-box protein [Planctomycetota bacterium]
MGVSKVRRTLLVWLAALGIALVDTEGRFLRVNPAFQRFLGYPAHEMQGRNIG